MSYYSEHLFICQVRGTEICEHLFIYLSIKYILHEQMFTQGVQRNDKMGL